MNAFDKQRREFLIKALSRSLGTGLFAAGAFGINFPAMAMGQIPRELPPGKSVYKLNGKVTVDTITATLDTKITPTSVIETGKSSNIIFIVGKDAFILRENSRLELQGDDVILKTLRLVSGKLLSVFGQRRRKERLDVKTTVAHIGIRGTGIYVEAEPDKSYVCTCYGTADLASIEDKLSQETVVTRHHDAPRYIHAEGESGKRIQAAPVINHTDDELELIETLVGRTVPFAFGGDYDASRKNQY